MTREFCLSARAKPRLALFVFAILFSSYCWSNLLVQPLGQELTTNIALQGVIDQFNNSDPDTPLVLGAFDGKPGLWDGHTKLDIVSGRLGLDYDLRASDGSLMSFNRTWRLQKFDQAFGSKLKASVIVNGKKYAVPYAQHYYGIFYRKSVFKSFGLAEPTTWSEFLIHCELLSSNDITPIVIGIKEPEALSLWFSYLNLRLNGAAFHRELLNGNVSYTDPRVALVMDKWRVLLGRNYAKIEEGQFDWKGALASLYNHSAAMVITGKIDHNLFNTPTYRDFGYFPFPSASSSSPKAEVVAVDAMGVSADVEDKLSALRFLAFVGESHVQSELAQSLGVLPAHKRSKYKLGRIAKRAFKRIDSTRELLPLVKDAVKNEFSDAMHRVFVGFVQDLDVEIALRSLENARKQHYIK